MEAVPVSEKRDVISVKPGVHTLASAGLGHPDMQFALIVDIR